MASKFSVMAQSRLKEILDDPQTPVLDAMIASIMLKTIEHGDMMRFDTLCNRTIGKVKEEITLTQDEDIDRLRTLTLKELIIFVKHNIPEAIDEKTLALLNEPSAGEKP